MPQPVVPQHEELHAVEGEFVGWLSEAYPELFEEFNEINEGKRNGNEPKYKLVR